MLDVISNFFATFAALTDAILTNGATAATDSNDLNSDLLVNISTSLLMSKTFLRYQLYNYFSIKVDKLKKIVSACKSFTTQTKINSLKVLLFNLIFLNLTYLHNIKIMKYNKSPTELLHPSNLQIDEMDLTEAFKFMLNDHSKVTEKTKS